MTIVPAPPLPTSDLSAASHDAHLESYLLAVLSDSNLPTGGFVASSGLEAWIQHGYLALAPSPLAAGPPATPPPDKALLAFVAHSLHSYARVNAPLLRAAHAAVWALRSPPSRSSSPSTSTSSSLPTALASTLAADQLADSLTLNHVARRASVAQGNALLTLYERAFAPPPGEGGGEVGEQAVREFVKEYRARVRRTSGTATGKGKEGEGEAYGHMTVAFGVLTAGVGLRIDSALPLLLFLHARSLLSSAVRLNTVGPYLAHRMLLWDVRPLVDEAAAAVAGGGAGGGGLARSGGAREGAELEERSQEKQEKDWWDSDPFWAPIWKDDPLVHPPPAGGPGEGAGCGTPVTTWPLGEIVASRHDQLFTKVFNS
ncbi:hypothetical protein JCM10213_003044 [Rhodosporidiobolus nylandii]